MWVMNGRAFAPPCTVWSIGVSTSRNPRLHRLSRRARIAVERTWTISREESLTIRSTYRCLVLASGSVSPACLSGRGTRHLDVMVNSVANTDSSPRLLVIT